MRHPKPSGNLDPIADYEARGDVGAGAAAGHVPNVEGELALAGRACHGVVARQAWRELELGVLSRRKAERPARLDGEPHALDVVRQAVEGDHAAAHDP